MNKDNQSHNERRNEVIDEGDRTNVTPVITDFGRRTNAIVYRSDVVDARSNEPVAKPTLTGDADFDDILWKCIDILKVKGDDYTIGTGDRLHNFKTVAEFTSLTPEKTLGVYFYKHVSAIFAFIKGGKESEPIEGRIADIINYMLLFYKMVLERRRGKLK